MVAEVSLFHMDHVRLFSSVFLLCLKFTSDSALWEGENFVVNQVLPLLRNIASSCIDVSCVNKNEPLQSWGTLALMDCLMTLDGLVAILREEVVVKELFEEGNCIYVQVLMQSNIGIPVLQVASLSPSCITSWYRETSTMLCHMVAS